MGAAISVLNLCKKCREDSKTSPTERENELEERKNARPSKKSAEIAPQIEIPMGSVEDDFDLTNLDPSSNSDAYFSAEDNKHYKEKYADERIEKKVPGKINWLCGKLLGTGSFGRVMYGLNTDSGEVMAVKQVAICDLKTANVLEKIKALELEIEILSQLKHKNIVRYIGSSREKEYFNIFLEFMAGGSIAELISKYGKFQENLIKIYAKQILEGLEYLHAHNVVHRDIKGANVLVDSNGTCKLADFGGAKKIYHSTNTGQFNSLKGTPYWMAPEVIKQTGHGRYADIWSFGCTIIEMATGRPPWSEHKNQFAALYYIGRGTGKPNYPKNFSEDGKNFLDLIFQRNPKLRANVRALINHPFIKREVNAVPQRRTRRIHLDPIKRVLRGNGGGKLKQCVVPYPEKEHIPTLQLEEEDKNQ